jgi:hypothetical protein
MPVFAVYERSADTCGNEDVVGPTKYIEADNILDVEELYPHGFLVGFYVRQISIETVNWVKIQQQLGVK